MKGKFLEDSFKKLNAINIIKLSDIELDETNHPFPNGTASIIKQINAVKGILLKGCEDETTLK